MKKARQQENFQPVAIFLLVFLSLTPFSPSALGSQEGKHRQENLTRLIRNSDLVFIGRVVLVGPSPGGWSGVVLQHQFVVYAVRDIVKGKWEYKVIRVYHVISYDGPVEAGKPEVSSEIFKTRNLLIVFAKKDPLLCHEATGILPFSDKNNSRVRQLLKASSSQPFRPPE